MSKEVIEFVYFTLVIHDFAFLATYLFFKTFLNK